jgi:hypothetical protein
MIDCRGIGWAVERAGSFDLALEINARHYSDGATLSRHNIIFIYCHRAAINQSD